MEIADDEGDVAYVVVHRLTGRVELRLGDFDPRDHMRKNGAGDDVKEDR